MNCAGGMVARADGGSFAGQPFGGGFANGARDRLLRLGGWRRGLAAAALGALAVLALPPLYVVPALVPAFVGLIWLLDGAASSLAAAGIAFLFGLGYFTAGLYWVANALLTKADQFGWLAPFAPIGLAAILAWHFIVPALAARWLTPRPGPPRIVVFAAAWLVAEWLRSWVLTGFPWNPIGSVWAFADWAVQPAAWFGVYGLGFFTVLAAAMPAVLAPRRLGGGRVWRAPVATLALLALVLAAGALRLASAAPVGMVDGVRLRLVQPDIDQATKWRRDLIDGHIEEQAEMSSWPAAVPPTDVIWSEVAAPMFLTENPQQLALVARHTPPHGLTLLGTLRRSGSGETFRLWNSLVALDAAGRIVGSYDKSHLVPFGEYMPLRSITNIANFTVGFVDFSAGPGITTLSLPGLPPVSPLICYEAIFPGAVARRDDRPAWLLNITNDGWYGNSAGPYQHFEAARLRAVEEGLPLVRVANTGISAIIDPYGRVLEHLGLGIKGVVDGGLPRPLARPTLYAQMGNVPLLVIAALVIAIAAAVGWRKQPLSGG